MRFSRIVCVLVCAIAFTAPLFGGGQQAEPNERLVVWSFMNEGETMGQWHAQVMEEFERANPEVETQLVFQGRDVLNILRTRLSDPNAPDFPDVVMQSDGLLSTLAEEGLLYDLTDELENTQAYDQEEMWIDTFDPRLMDLIALEGNWYYVPESMYTKGFFYDEVMFEEYGLDVPRTWDEFVNVAETLKENGIAPLSLDGNIDFYNVWHYISFAQRLAGPDRLWQAANGEISFEDHPGFLEAAEYVALFAENEWFQDGYMGSAFPAAQALFTQGETGMVWVGAWFPSEMSDEIPPEMDMNIFDLPPLPGAEEERVVEIWGNAHAIMESSNNKENAIEFIKIMSSLEMQDPKHELKNFSPLVGATPVEELDNMTSIIENATAVTNNYNKLNTLGAYWGSVFQPLGTQLIAGNLSPEEFIDELTQQTDAYYGN